MVFNNNLLLGAAGQGGAAAFDTTLIGNSVWLDGTADYFSRSYSGSGNSTTEAIFAFWYQRYSFGVAQSTWFEASGFGGLQTNTGYGGGDTLVVNTFDAGGTQVIARHTRLLRDVAWYHIIVSIDMSQATTLDKIKFYINGEQDTTINVQNLATTNGLDMLGARSKVNFRIGENAGSTGHAYAQYCYLDGVSIQQGDYAITDFLDTYTLGTNGSQYIPKVNTDIAALATAAGGNSICLDFADSADLGNDISSNNNDFTANSMSSDNQSINTPSKYYPKVSNIGTPSGDTAANYTMGKGSNRMVYSGANQTYKGLISTQLIQSDDSPIYWEYYLESGSVGGASGGRVSVGLCVPHFNAGNASGFSGAGGNNPSNLRGVIYDNGSQGATTGSTLIGVGDIQNLAYEPSTGKIWFGVNGTWNNGSEAASTTLNPSGHDYQATVQDYVFFIAAARSTDIGVLNFGDNPSMSGNITAGTETDAKGHGLFKYAVPSGFFAPVSANLTAPDYQGIDYFNATLYTGDGTAIGSGGNAVTGTGFKPDLVWIKNRDAADSHALYDVVRGTTKQIESDSTSAETTESEGLTTFGSDGFTVGNLDQVNTNTEDYVAWQWLGSNSTSTNTNGSLNTTVTTASADHFSIVSWTMSDPAGAKTLGHGLTAAPELIIIKNRTDAGTNWPVYSEFAGNTKYLYLSTTAAATTFNMWQDTSPNSTVFYVSSNNEASGSANDEMVAYCFRSVPGVCKVGSYEGNGSTNGTYLSLGFKPAFVLFKSVDSTSDWQIFDKSRNGFNVRNNELEANDTAVEDTSTNFLDLLSDGFKMRIASDPNVSETFIYLAMADIGGNGTLPPIYGR